MNIFILSASWKWQWADFVITVVGSLLGFFFAILAAWGANKWMEHNQGKSIKKELIKELEDFLKIGKKNEILKIIESGDDIDHKILFLPHLERIVATNQLFLISKQLWYNEIMLLYSIMNEINHWYANKSDYYFNNILDIEKIDGKVRNQKKAEIYNELCKKIKNETDTKFYGKISDVLNLMNK